MNFFFLHLTFVTYFELTNPVVQNICDKKTTLEGIMFYKIPCFCIMFICAGTGLSFVILHTALKLLSQSKNLNPVLN